MNILKKFTLKNIKLNKKRSIVTIIGIILSAALICTVSGMFSSFQKTMINAIIKETGDYHVTFKNVEKDDLKYIKENRNVDEYYLEEQIGYVKFKEKDIYDSYISIKAYDNNYLENVKIVSGRKPKLENEIVMASSLKKLFNYEIGDNIELAIYTSPNEYIYDSERNITLEYNQNKQYKIVGFIDEDYLYNDYIMITKLNDISNKVNIKVKYNNIKNTYKLTKEINPSEYEVDYNLELLRWSFVSSNESTMKTLYSLVGIIIFIIILSSIFVIRNSFAISTTEKMKQFGMLSSIGATKKQIKKSVLYEGFILGIIAIPLGILLGLIVINILVIFSDMMLKDMLDNVEFIVDIPIEAIIISIILSGITIYLSSISSAHHASKISPMEAIRNNNEIKIKGKKLKTPKIIKKIFGIGGEIAYKNLKRNKKKYRTTIISLVVSISIFISLSTFIHYGFNISNIYYKKQQYNISVGYYDAEEVLENYNKIIKLDNIKSYSIKKTLSIKLDSSYLNKEGLNYYGGDDAYISLLAIGDNNYKKYLKELNLDYQETKDKIIYIKNTTYIENKKIVDLYNFKNKVKGIIDDKEYELEIIKTTDKTKYGVDTYSYITGVFLVSDELINKIGNYNIESLDIDSSDADKLEEEINKLDIETIYVTNIDALATQMNNMVIWISVFLYGFIIVISLIGITNIFNTITTNMNLRSKEFAMLKSIGMTKKEFNRMIRLESIFYGIKSLLIGCTIGIILSYIIYNALLNSIDFGFELPIKTIIISIIFIFIVIGLIMKYSLNKINKQNIIETIRKDNI